MIEKINSVLNPILWGWPVLIAILLAGANFSFRLGFFQFRHCILWLKSTLGSLFSPKKKALQGGKSGISQFQALTTALAGSIGTGNIVGVATALTIGGPGAIFWMWVSALFGMATIFAENVLGMKYRVKDSEGHWQGGAMYYLERGLHSKFLAGVFAAGCILASIGMGNMAQSNSIAEALEDTFGVNPAVTGVCIAVLLLAVICGGGRRTAQVTEKLVPLMAVGYLLAASAVLFLCRDHIGGAFQQIFQCAFGLRPAVGGIGGMAVTTAMIPAMKCGISRGIFTNEAGLGSSSLAHCSSEHGGPVEQGMWGIFQVFIDTIVMCTVTALVILASGALSTGKDGAPLSASAFSLVFGKFGGAFIALSITLFAFATLLGWSYYGERGVQYLLGRKFLPIYRVLFAAAAWAACSMDLRLVWDISDTFNGLLAIPNLIALFLLGGEVIDETKRWFSRAPSRAGEFRPGSRGKPNGP